MSEYIAEFFDSPDGGPLKFDGFREGIVRCRDCDHNKAPNRDEGTDCEAFHAWIGDPDFFCKWGERDKFVTCECGEEVEAFGRLQTCPSCGRTVRA